MTAATENVLAGKHVLVLSTNYGVDTSEIGEPIRRLREAGADVSVAAPEKAPIVTLAGDREPGEQFTPDLAIAEVDPSQYDLVVLPGGTINADDLRVNTQATDTVRTFANAGTPIAAICHAPWALINAGLAEGRNLTSYGSIQTDLRNAGAHWQDAEVVVDDADGWTLITSRSPADLGAFIGAITRVLTASNN